MHDDFQDLEIELNALRPRASSVKLLARLERELDPVLPVTEQRGPAAATSWRWWKWAAWPVAAAAVALALLLTRPMPISKTAVQQAPVGTVVSAAPAADIYKPVRADNVLYNTREEGAVTLADGTPARRVRSQYVDTITWKNPRTNASLQWSIPRDEVRVVPVSFQ